MDNCYYRFAIFCFSLAIIIGCIGIANSPALDTSDNSYYTNDCVSVVLNGNEYTLNKKEQVNVEELILKMQNNNDGIEMPDK